MNRLFSCLFTIPALLSFSAPVAAQSAKSLTVYTYESFLADWGPGPKVKAAFEQTCECTLNFVGVADGVALLTRLKLEGETSQADVALGLDTNLIEEAKETGLFAPHGIDTTSAKIPGDFKDDIFVPYDYAHFAVVYDTSVVKNPPRSLKELVEGDPQQKIVIEDPRTSTPGLGLLLWIKSVYGDKAPDAWAKLKNRILTVTPGWSEAYGLFTKGEAPMVFSYVTSPAYHMVEEKTEKYQAARFEEGHYIQVEISGMLKATKNRQLAEQFLAFTLSPEFQNIIPTTNWMMPAAATQQPLPDAFGRLVQPTKTFLMDPQDVAKHRQDWIREWLSAMSMN